MRACVRHNCRHLPCNVAPRGDLHHATPSLVHSPIALCEVCFVQALCMKMDIRTGCMQSFLRLSCSADQDFCFLSLQCFSQANLSNDQQAMRDIGWFTWALQNEISKQLLPPSISQKGGQSVFGRRPIVPLLVLRFYLLSSAELFWYVHERSVCSYADVRKPIV